MTPCGKVSFTEPATAVIHDMRPRIAWRPIAEAMGYVLWIESRIPEGRVLLTQEVRTTEPHWIPPFALTEGSATVKVRVTAQCPQDPQPTSPARDRDAATATRFRIEPAQTCGLPGDPAASWENGGLKLQWPVSTAASEYEIAIRSAIDGRLHATQSSSFPQTALATPPTGIWIASVRPRCGKSTGAARHVPLSVP